MSMIASSEMIAGARVILTRTEMMGDETYSVYLEDREGYRFYGQHFDTPSEARCIYRIRLAARALIET